MKKTRIEGCEFIKGGGIIGCRFNDKVSFDFSIFHDQVAFRQIDLKSIATFNNTIFIKSVEFSFFKSESNMEFIYTSFRDRSRFDSINFKKLNINMVNVHSSSRNDIVYKPEPAYLNFMRCNFNYDTTIARINLSNISYNYCDLSNINYSRCDWNIKDNRLIFENETFEIRDAEEHYRTIKKNFDQKKNWELSGYAYVSEMEMRKKTVMV